MAFSLNDFHEKNWQRMASGVFGPSHDLIELAVCVQEEVGELASAALGVTGKKKRKAGKTTEHVLDACSDAMTYLSLWLYCIGERDLQRLYEAHHHVDSLELELLEAVVKVQESTGTLAQETMYSKSPLWAPAMWTFKRLIRVGDIASGAGWKGYDWRLHLGTTFNMVSDRAGSPIKVEL